MATKKTAKKAAAKKAPAKKAAAKKAPAAKKAAAKKAPAADFLALAAPMQPSEALGAVVGAKPIPRTEITKRVWDYIKKNDLQDKVNRRNINADDQLKPIFGGKAQVTMFEMTALVNKHLKPA
jgi:chromatin remodeling complex protein RSC6